MTPQDLSSTARAKRAIRQAKQSPFNDETVDGSIFPVIIGRRVPAHPHQPPPGVSGFTLLWWIAVGCAVGSLISIAILEWVKRS